MRRIAESAAVGAGRRSPARHAAAILTVAAGGLLFQPSLPAWGLVAHRIVTAEAAGRMPPDVAPFFSEAAEALAEISLEPDTVLKARDRKEPSRHYINLEELDAPPFKGIPREKGKAVERFGERRLARAGTLPWRVLKVFRDLKAAMKKGRRERILEEAGHLAHYVGDLFQPLHVTADHDGERTCNQGVHTAFEREMIELRPEAYREALARGGRSVEALRRPAESVFGWMKESWALAADVLAADTAAVEALKREGGDYYESMERTAGVIARRQMSAAADALASLWYTAWVDAGSPDLR